MRIDEYGSIIGVFDAPKALHELLEKTVERAMALDSSTTKTTTTLTGMPGGGNSDRDGLYVNYLSAKESIDKIRLAERRARMYVTTVMKAATDLTQREASILCKRYLHFTTWSDIAKALDVSERTVFRDLESGINKCDEALRKLQTEE